MKNVGTKGGDERDRVVVKVNDAGEGVKEVSFDELFLRYPKLLTMVIDNGILTGVTVDGKGADGSLVKIGEEVGYRLFR